MARACRDGNRAGAEGPAFESRLAHWVTPGTLGRSSQGRPMILGMSIATFTLVHTVLSLGGIVAGLVTAGATATGTRLHPWAAPFLVTAGPTRVTRVCLSFDQLLPPPLAGISS